MIRINFAYRQTSRWIVLLFLLLVLNPTFLISEDAPSAPITTITVTDQPSSESESSDDTTGPKVEIRQMGEGRISMDFRDASLPEVLEVLSQLSGANFVAAEDAAAKKFNLFLDNVTFDDAFKAIIKGNGLVATKVGEENIYMIRVGTGEDALVPLETRIFKLKYVRATKVKILSLSESSSSSGSSPVGGVSGSTSVGTSATISGGEPAEIKTTVEDLLSPRGKVTVNDRDNSLIVTDTEEKLDEVAKVIDKLDHPVDQVLIEAIIVEKTIDIDKFLGTEWGTGSEGSIGTISGARGVFNIPSINQFGDLFNGNDLVNSGVGISLGSYDFSQLEATLKALQTDSRTKVLAQPKVLVLDNEPAFIKITVNEVIGTNSQVSAGGGTGSNLQATTAERTETGVTLKVTPLINDEKMITMLLEPRYATADTSTFSSSFRDPRIRASRTTLSVESGRIVSISGLMQRDETKIKRKLPILGDIPLFGVFFTKWTTQKVDRELIIFLRPHIIRHGDMGLVQVRSIPDKMTTPDEEVAEFWKVWEKPWFKEAVASKHKSKLKESDQFFDSQENMMDQALIDFEHPKTDSKPGKNIPSTLPAKPA